MHTKLDFNDLKLSSSKFVVVVDVVVLYVNGPGPFKSVESIYGII